jgi:carboxyl-terminal processing protease
MQLFLFMGWLFAAPLDDAEKILGLTNPTIALDALERAAIKGMLEHVDLETGNAGSTVMNEEEKQRYQAWNHGLRRGYGMRVRIVTGRGLLIDSVLSESPAERAGLLKNDLIVAFADQPFTGMPPEQVLPYLEQPYEGTVAVDVLRNGELRRFQLVRGDFWIQGVSILDSQLQVHFWSEDSANEIEKILKNCEHKKLILDLRDNEGGMIEQVIETLSLFLGPDIVVGYRQTSEKKEALSTSGEKAWDGELVILINRGTKGISEFFVQSLRENMSVPLVGEPSAGLSSEFHIYPLSKGLYINIADTELISAMGMTWRGGGIKPDVMVRTSMNNPSLSGRIVDLQLETALRVLGVP